MSVFKTAGSSARRLVAVGIILHLAGCGSSTSGGASAPPGPVLKNCQSGSTDACSSFTTPTNMEIQLGPYGAQMDVNVGKGFENVIQSGDMLPANAGTCQAFASFFGEDPKLTAQLLQTSQNGITIDFALYTVYRPANWKAGEKVPVITWGNGTCAQPEGYGALLRYVASYGYFVVAANSRFVGQGSPAPMLHAVDFAAAANMDSSSPYYGKLDMTKVGAMGHSQGGGATVSAASDGRVKDIIIFNSSDAASKPYLAVSGDLDLTRFTAATMATAINGASVPSAYLYYHNPAGMGQLRGHLVLMLSPDRVTGPTVAWWQMMFRNDSASRDMFVGSSCGLCGHSSDFDFGEHNL